MAEDFERQLEKLSPVHYRTAPAEAKQTIRRWLGSPDGWTEASFHLAKQWFEKCANLKGGEHHAYAGLSKEDDIGALTARDWDTIQDLPALAAMWSEVQRQDQKVVKQVRRMARPGQAPGCVDQNVERRLKDLRVTMGAEGGAGLGLVYTKPDGTYDLFPLFKAYVFYRSWASWRQQARWLLEDWRVPIQNIQTAVAEKWAAWKDSPRALTALAFVSLALAFLALAWDSLLQLVPGAPAPNKAATGYWLLWYLPLWGPLLGLLVWDFGLRVWRHSRSVVISGLALLLTLASVCAVFAPPFLALWSKVTGGDKWVFFVAVTTLFLVTLSIVWIKSIRRNIVFLLAFILDAVILLQQALGMELDFIARSTAVMLLSLWALYLLYRAGSNLEDSKIGASPLRVFLTDVASAGRWKKPLENWHWPNGLLFTLLFVLALWLFFSLFRVGQETCSGPGSATVEIVYPSWLSDRDQGSVYLTLTAPTTPTQQVYLEPVAGNVVFLNLEKTVSPSPSLALTPTVTTTAATTATVYSRWQVQTLSPALQWGVTHWQFRASLVDGQGVHNLQPNDPTNQGCVVSIPRVKLPFGLRGFLEVQPFVTLVGILYGLAQTILQLWVGEKAFAEGKGTPNERQVKG